MLMMSRRAGEAILIGDDIEIVIAHIGRTRVKVGIRAPRQTPVLAREMRLVREENLAAAGASAAPLAGLPRLLARLRSPQVPPGRADEKSDRQEAGNPL
jgi:carbon storage regulator